MVRSSVALAAAVATLATAASASSAPDTVKYTFDRRRVSIEDAPAGIVKRQQAKTVNSVISNDILLYYINVTVGTPAQKLVLQLDTGSSDIWFPASNSQICERNAALYCPGGSYNQGSSSTYSDPGFSAPFEISYVDGSQVEGNYISDVLNIGSTKLTNVTMASATQTDRGLGIMGIAFQSGESSAVTATGQQGFTYPNVINSLKDQGFINVLAYSLWLDDVDAQTGSILFGGVDTTKYMGSLVALPIQIDAQSQAYTSFTVTWTGLTITGGGQTSTLSPSSPQPAILDSGTTLTYVPDDIAESIFNGVGVTSDANYGDVVPCSLANDDLTFSFQFGGSNGPTIKVPLSEFVIPLVTTDGSQPKFRNGQDACTFGISAAGQNPILFGDTFLRSAYVVYDLENLEIGIAQTNFSSSTGEGNVQAFSASGSIPDVSSTASGATVAQTYSGQPLITETAQAASGEAGATGTSRSATFILTSSSSTASSTSASSHNAASSMHKPTLDTTGLTFLGVTVAAFVFGGFLVI